MVHPLNHPAAAPMPRRAAAASRLLLVAALLLTAFVALAGRADAVVYYTAGDNVMRAGNNGAGTAPVNTAVAGRGIPTDLASTPKQIGWISAGGTNSTTVQTVSHNGTFPTAVVNGLVGPTAITGQTPGPATTTASDVLYIAEGGDLNRINRKQYGKAVEKTFITTGVTAPGGLAANDTHIFWTNTTSGTIGRANIDGTGVNPSFITGTGNATGLAVDAGHIYWANENGTTGSTIGRANIDGTDVNQSFITGADVPHDVAVNGASIYWTNVGADGTGTTIGRAALDGTGVDQSFLTSTTGAVRNIAADDLRGTQTTHSCDPNTLAPYRDTTCTVTVKDVDGGTPQDPTGDVRFTAGATGGRYTPFDAFCTLVKTADGSASCTILYTPATASRTGVNTASYTGTGNLESSRGTAEMTTTAAIPVGTTTTDLDCSIKTLPIETPTVCTVTVTDTAADPTPPTGEIGISRTKPTINPQGIFLPGRDTWPYSGLCTLQPTTTNASACTVSYYPAQVGDEILTASFGGKQGWWTSSKGTENLTTGAALAHPTTTSVVCSPTALKATTTTECVVTVEDENVAYSRFPTGGVQLDSSAAGALSPGSGYCTLNPAATVSVDPPHGAQSSCRVRFTPTYGGAVQLTATYDGTSEHQTSTTQVSLAVDGPPAPIAEPPVVPKPPVVVPPTPPIGKGPLVIAPPQGKTPPAAAELAVAKPSAKERAAFAKAGKVTLSVTVPGSGTVSGKATAKIGKKKVSVGTAKLTAKAGGKQRLSLRLSKQARAALKRSGRLTVSVEVRFGSTRKTVTVALKAAKKPTSSTSTKGTSR